MRTVLYMLQLGNAAEIFENIRSDASHTPGGFEHRGLEDISLSLSHTTLFIYLHDIVQRTPGNVTKL